MQELRSAPRVQVIIPTLIEKIGRRPQPSPRAAPPALESVIPDPTGIGLTAPGIIRDLSVNGVFVACAPLPLLSRVAFTFPLRGWGQADAIGWVLWRRIADTVLPIAGRDTSLPAGIGVLFEAISLDARIAIAQLVAGALPVAP